MARVFEIESLFTANVADIDKAEKKIKATGQAIEKKPIVAKIDADEKGALAGMDRVEAAAKRIVSQETVAKLDANVEKATTGITRVQQQLEYLRSVDGVLEVTADIKKAESDLQRMERQLKALQGARAKVEVTADTSAATAALAEVPEVAGKAGAEAGDELGSNIINALAGIPVAGAVAGLGLLAAGALVKAFNDGLQIEVGFDRLQGLTGISESDAGRLGYAAGEAYANVFGESIESNMDTARLALQFDIIDPSSSVAASQQVIQGLAGIADVLGEDVQPVAATVATLLSSGLASSAEEAFDLIATGAREGVNRNEDLLDTLTEYPAVFDRLGLSGPLALGLISQGLQAGARNSDLAADALKEFQIRATDGSETSAAGFEAIGLSAAEMTAQIAAGGEGAAQGLDQVLDGLRNMEDPVARNAAAVALFGTQAEDLGDALFALDPTTAIEGLNGVQGAAQAMFDTLSSNDASAIEGAQRNIEVAVQGIQGALAVAFSDPLQEAADFISQNRGPMVSFFGDLVNGAFDFGDALIEAAAAGTEGFGSLVSDILPGVLESLAGVMTLFDLDAANALDELAAEMEGFDETASNAADTLRNDVGGALNEAREQANGFIEPQEALGYLNDASLRLADSLGLVGTTADGSVASIEGLDVANLGASESGLLLESQIRNSVAALGEEISAAQTAGETQEQLAARYTTGTEALGAQLEAMGLTQVQAQALIDTVLQTPTSATTAYDSNAQQQQQLVQNLANRITTLPDGSVVIDANTGPAQNDLNNWIANANGRRVRIVVETATPGTLQVAGTNVQLNARGGITEFMAAGGIRPLTPMQQGIAQMVAPSTWRVVGDRSDVAEAYIPLDGSPRSMAILAETIRRMGGQPMASGGVVVSGTSGSGSRALYARIELSSGELLGIVRTQVQDANDELLRSFNQG